MVNDLETAGHWLEVQGERPGVVIAPADLDEKASDAIAQTIEARIPGGTAAIVLVGAVTGRSEARHLGDLGFRWLVRRPFTADELMLGVMAALSAGNWEDAREDPRVPVDLRVDVARPGSIDVATVRDLSASGLFLGMSDPPELGAAIVIELELGARLMLLRGNVVHCSRRATPTGDLGVGVQFERLDEADARTIRDYVEARLGSVRL